MAKPTAQKENHGSDVSAYVHSLQDARVEGEHPGIGKLVSEFASEGRAGGPKDDDEDTDNGLPNADANEVIIVHEDAEFKSFTGDTSIQDAIDAAQEGDTIVIGAGEYAQTFTVDKSLTIVGEDGAVIDGSGFSASASLQSTILLNDGFSGGSISNLEVIAVENGNALLTAIGDPVQDVTVEDSTFDAGANTSGSLVYLNPVASGFTFEGNTFLGAALETSPLLGIEADDVTVSDNEFGVTAGDYAEVEVFAGEDGVTTDVVFTSNTGLPASEIEIA